MDLGLGNIERKIIDNADKIGMLLGGYSLLKSITPNPFKAAELIAEGLMNDPHFPDLGSLKNYLLIYDKNHTLMNGVKYGVIGWALDELNLHPTVTKIGKVLKEAGFGAAKSSAIVAALAYSGYAHSPMSTGGGGSSYNSQDNSVRGL